MSPISEITLVLLYQNVWTILSSEKLQQFIANIKLLKNLNPWQKEVYTARLETLANLKNELEDLGFTVQLTEAEKFSPQSGVHKTFVQYLNEVQDERLEMLRYALLNGIYGDYTVDLRESLYRIAQIIQPLDIRVLQYLHSECPNIDHYHSVSRSSWSENNRNSAFVSTSLSPIDIRQTSSGTETVRGGLSLFAEQNGIEENVIKYSIDRLKAAKLICTPVNQAPYGRCVPTETAGVFLRFVSDPRNSRRQD
jgi:hypothetical protein